MLTSKDLYNNWVEALIPILFPDKLVIDVETNTQYNLKDYYDGLTDAEKKTQFISIQKASDVIHSHMRAMIQEYYVKTGILVDVNVLTGEGSTTGVGTLSNEGS